MNPRGPYSFTRAQFEDASFGERVWMNCREWMVCGYGAPYSVYLLYLVKIAVLGVLWALCCEDSSFTQFNWMFTEDSFHKLILFSILYEVAGFASGSGPLTGKYMPPFGNLFYNALRVGTVRLPPFPRVLPFTRGSRRTLLDVVLYAGLVVALLRALMSSDTLGFSHFAPVIAFGVAASLRDKTVFLAMRSEHYIYTLVALCFSQPTDSMAGAKLALHAVWFWAGVSKISHHFAYVNMVMSGNHLFMPGALKRLMHTEDMRPSVLCEALTHLGTAFEISLPLALLVSGDSPATYYLCVAMSLFHAFIVTNVPMGVPLEWNFVVVHSMWYFYGTSPARAAVTCFHMQSPALIAFFLLVSLVVPLWGNARPSDVSFLLSYRYYAGLWPYSVWLFKPRAYEALWEHLVMASPPIDQQLAHYSYDPETIQLLKTKIACFRSMHLQGRCLQTLLPVLAAGDIESFIYADGEILAGQVLGYNFGDGHLAFEGLMAAMHEACGFLPGDVRVLTVEGQALLSDHLHWKMHDATQPWTPLKQGRCSIRALRALPPWTGGRGVVSQQVDTSPVAIDRIRALNMLKFE